jgi:hypothetical protein
VPAPWARTSSSESVPPLSSLPTSKRFQPLF